MEDVMVWGKDQPHVIVTSYGDAGLKEYGEAFTKCFLRFWPIGTPLLVYHEGHYVDGAGITPIHLIEEVEDCRDFLERHKDNDTAKGRHQDIHRWHPKAEFEGYSFRHDAYKFCRKIFATRDAARRVGPCKLFWLDADVETYMWMSMEFLDQCLPDDFHTCFLGRPHAHSECGFVGYNLHHPEAELLIETFANLYATDEVFNLQEWHDSWVYDWVRSKLPIKGNDLLCKRSSEAFANSPLGRYMRHHKGARKAKWRTPS